MGRGRDVITSLLFSDFLWSFPLSDYFCRTLQKPPCIRVTILLVSLTVLIAAFTPTYFITKALVSMKGGWGWPHLLWLSKLRSHVTIVSDCSRAAFYPAISTKAPISMKNGWGCHTYSTEI